jgi:G3E family GTPase
MVNTLANPPRATVPVTLVTVAELDELERKIRSMNAMAKIYRTENAQVNMDAVLEVGGFDLSHALTIDPDFLGEEAHVHDESVKSVALVLAGRIYARSLLLLGESGYRDRCFTAVHRQMGDT